MPKHSDEPTQSSNSYFKDYLKPNQGIAQERFAPFDIPSLVNGQRVPAGRIRSDMVGGPKYLINYDLARDWKMIIITGISTTGDLIVYFLKVNQPAIEVADSNLL